MEPPKIILDAVTPMRSFDKHTTAVHSQSNSIVMSQANYSADRLKLPPSNFHRTHGFMFESPRKHLRPKPHRSCQVEVSAEEKLSHKLRKLKRELEEEKDDFEVPFPSQFGQHVRPAEQFFTLESEGPPVRPQLKWCPACSRETMAITTYRPTAKTLWTSLGIFFTGGVLGCFLVPYLTDNCKEVELHCSHCNSTL